MYPAFPENGSTSYLCAQTGTVFIKKVYTGGTVFMNQLYVPYNRLLVPRFKFLNFQRTTRPVSRLTFLIVLTVGSRFRSSTPLLYSLQTPGSDVQLPYCTQYRLQVPMFNSLIVLTIDFRFRCSTPLLYSLQTPGSDVQLPYCTHYRLRVPMLNSLIVLTKDSRFRCSTPSLYSLQTSGSDVQLPYCTHYRLEVPVFKSFIFQTSRTAGRATR